MNVHLRYLLAQDASAPHRAQILMLVEDELGRRVSSKCIATIEDDEDVMTLMRYLHSGGRIEIPKREADALLAMMRSDLRKP